MVQAARSPYTLRFWRRFLQNYRIGRIDGRPGVVARARTARDAFHWTAWGA